jgi:DNA polymerase-1
MFRLLPDTNTKEHLYQGVVVREIAKTINYGLSYGMGAQSLAQRVNVSVEEARKLMRTYFQTYPGMDHWLRQAARQAQKRGYAASCYGRKRFLSFAGASQAERASMERMARNHPIQATNADILKRAMAFLYDILPSGVHVVLVVHDEIVLECPESLAKESIELLKSALVEACRADLKVVYIPEPEVLKEKYWKKG